MTASSHVARDVLDRWRAGRLPAVEALAVSDHLDECPTCAAAVEDPLYCQEVQSAVERALDAGAASGGHLPLEQIERWVSQTVDAAEAELSRQHLDECASCRAAAEDLAAFVAGAGVPEGPRVHALRWAPLAAVIVLTLVGLAFAVARLGRAPSVGTATRATTAPLAVPGASEVSPPSGVAETSLPAPQLDDGAVQLRLKPDGAFDGVPAAWRREVAEVLDRQELALPATALAVLRAPTPERGATASHTEPEVILEAPLSTVVLEDRPTFLWSGPQDATYRVDVFGRGYRRVDGSGELQGGSWIPAAPLPKGEVLTWKLTMVRPEGEPVLYPVAPSPPAVFQVANEAALEDIREARTTGSHLLVGLALWRSGAVREGAAELAALAAANPSSPLARRLALSSARAVRRIMPTDG